MESNYLSEALKKITFVQVLIFLALFFGALFLISTPYSCTFAKNGISNSTTVWGEYGSYISGITSILNLIVFILLTVYVAQLGDSNNKKQLTIQKKILLAQFRQSELSKMSENINETFKFYSVSNVDELYLKYRLLYSTVLAFFDGYKTLFPIVLIPENKVIVDDYKETINDFLQFLRPVRKEMLKDLSDGQTTQLDYYLNTIYSQNIAVLELLSGFVINNLESD